MSDECEACHGTGGYHGIMGGPDSPVCPRCMGSGRKYVPTMIGWLYDAAIRAAVEQEIAAWLRDEADPSCSGGQTLLAYADAIASGKYRDSVRALAEEGQS